MNRIYLSGKITDNKDYISHFQEAYIYCKDKFNCDIVNPSLLNIILTKGSWCEYMALCIPLLKMCDTIFMMKTWKDSKGAIEELRVAKELGLKIIFEEGGIDVNI